MKNLINLYRKSNRNFDTSIESTSDSQTYKRLKKDETCSCSYCNYHRNENYRGKHYSTNKSIDHLNHPSWKLVSKNKKQYIPNTVEIFEESIHPWSWGGRVYTFYTVVWKNSKYYQ